ncbi:AAA domain-containing protein [Rhizobium pisi]|uniref:AAA domain-containing protein n=1 Tax=Rhizobium pisi TaxID=574561 RepID=UPI001FDF656F|nr:AAA domain-containing protein [Rhizobium pisi]
MPSISTVRERFLAIEPETGKRGILTLYADGSEPDPSVYDAIRNMPDDHLPQVYEVGRWHDRAFEISEEITGGSLEEAQLDGANLGVVNSVVFEIGKALGSFSQAGLRHRDITPANILIRTRDPLDLVVAGFGSARLSDYDLDIVAPLETTRYMAPEAIAGGVAAASDWWSLGMITLEIVTAGACFEGVNPQAFLIHVLTKGVTVPEGLDPSIERLLKGLLARDHRERFRGEVVVISGDEKQMPPTAFFASRVENDEADVFDGEELDEDATEVERETYNETWNRREIKDCPDLLQLGKSVLPTTTLQIHYRSAYRELIGFSNSSFYGNRLSVPVRHPDEEILRAKPIEVIRADGIYSDQTNEIEARRIVQVLADIWRRPGNTPTVGVVTFNRKQADLIEEILEKQAERDDWFRNMVARERDRVERGEDVGFFVKNVENVQGDERDYIIFSSTFGKNAQGSFRRNFGVLGQKGGERRLNVAVTRARIKVIMVTSMPIGDVSDMLSSRRKPTIPRDYLQGYLEYARSMSDGDFKNGRSLLDRMLTERSGSQNRDGSDLDGFAASVAAYLAELGVTTDQVNDGSAFSLDFAVEDPKTGLYGLGIECDAPRHRILDSARAREIWRPSVLGRSIPVIHRISSHGWYHAREEEKQRLRDAVQSAIFREAAE